MTFRTIQEAFTEVFSRLATLESDEPSDADKVKFQKMVDEVNAVTKYDTFEDMFGTLVGSNWGAAPSVQKTAYLQLTPEFMSEREAPYTQYFNVGDKVVFRPKDAGAQNLYHTNTISQVVHHQSDIVRLIFVDDFSPEIERKAYDLFVNVS